MAAAWSYADTDGDHPPELPSEPTWRCPDGSCECHAVQGAREKLEFSVLLVDMSGRSMGGARCRFQIDGIVVNEDEPYANDDGWITVVVDHAPETVLVEWAPPDMPAAPCYPFRARYYVELRNDDPDEAARRRLHNLGFSAGFDLRENVREFQRTYGYVVSGEVDDIRADLAAFHDDPCLPETTDDGLVMTSDGAPAREPAKKPKAPKVPRPEPKGRGNKKVGGGPGKPGRGPSKPRPVRVVVNVFSFFSLGMTAPMRYGKRPKTQRWGAGDAHPVAGAELRIFAPGGSIREEVPPARVGKGGQAVLDLTKLPDGTYTLLLSPPAGHELRPGANDRLATGTDRAWRIGSMVGPADKFPGDRTGHTRFRMLEVTVEVQGARLVRAALPADMFVAVAFGVAVAHGGVLLEAPTVLWIDYKPDFVQILPSKEGDKVVVNWPFPLSKAQFIHLHHTAAPTPGSTLDEFTTTNAKGAHYLVDVDGFIVKLTDEMRSVAHTGKAHWYDLDSAKHSRQKTIEHFNDLSIGIEQVNEKHAPYPASQLAATSWLVGMLRDWFGINRHNVLGDGDTAMDDKYAKLGRKPLCPGPTYDWTVLERAGNATAPALGAEVPHDRYENLFSKDSTAVIGEKSKPTLILALQRTIAELGYFVVENGAYDAATKAAIDAFRNRYFSGPSRSSDHARVKGLEHADFLTVTRMHEVLADRAGYTYHDP